MEHLECAASQSFRDTMLVVKRGCGGRLSFYYVIDLGTLLQGPGVLQDSGTGCREGKRRESFEKRIAFFLQV